MSSEGNNSIYKREQLLDTPLFKWRRFDDKIHDLDTNIERAPLQSSPLSALPIELQEQIFGCIFHDHTNNQHCKDFHLGLGNLGCRCGAGLSRANYHFYNETRVRYYQCARFVFATPEACQRFLGIGRITKNMGNLSIAYKEEYSESSLLRPIFRDLVFLSSLESLHLRIKQDPLQRRRPLPPIYMPTVDQALKAEKYDLLQRPSRHPLSDLKSIRALVVQGQPGHEIEEALLKLSFMIEDIAKREGKSLQTKGQWRPAFGEWFYEIKIIDPHDKESELDAWKDPALDQKEPFVIETTSFAWKVTAQDV